MGHVIRLGCSRPRDIERFVTKNWTEPSPQLGDDFKVKKEEPKWEPWEPSWDDVSQSLDYSGSRSSQEAPGTSYDNWQDRRWRPSPERSEDGRGSYSEAGSSRRRHRSRSRSPKRERDHSDSDRSSNRSQEREKKRRRKRSRSQDRYSSRS